MPLASNIPVIDNRTFTQLNDEIKTRIPRYAPEWTDFNDSDPGIALAQLFAWMTEMLAYRMAQVPELNYIKFLQLIGIELNPAQPAIAQLTFPVLSTFVAPYVIVPARTQVSAASSQGEAPVVFETDSALIAISAALEGIQSFDGYAYHDLTETNRSVRDAFFPLGPNAFNGSALMLGFSGAGGLPNVELDLSVWIPMTSNKGSTPPALSCGFGNTPSYPAATILWQYYNGVTWRPLNVRKDDTLAFTRSGQIRLQLPAANSIPPATLGNIARPLMWIRALLQKSQYSKPPALLAIRTNTVSATQAQTVQNEILGGSSGTANQVFQLANTPVLAGSLTLQIDQGDGDGWLTWTEVDDFYGSGPDDLHYVLDRTSGEIRLGDGVNGAIAIANPDNADANVIAVEYRHGGGQAGNLAAGQINTLTTSVAGIDDNGVTNLFASAGGREEETLAQARARAPLALQSRSRAVTIGDYEHLAQQAGDIRRAKALPLFNPNFPTVTFPGAVTVIVVPDANTEFASAQFNPTPSPSDADLRTVCAYLNERRLLTTELYVVGPTYQKVSLEVEAIAHDSADLASVSSGIQSALQTYFHPLIGGEDGAGWPFGGPIFFSLVYRMVLQTTGVQSVKSVAISLDDQASAPCTDLEIKPNALLYCVEPRINVHYGM